MQTLLSALLDHATIVPSKPALLFGRNSLWTQLTFRDLFVETERWAAIFAEASPCAGGVVFIILDHRLELYFAYLGAMRAGLVPSFLSFPTPKQDPDLYWAGQAELFAHVQPVCIVTYEPAASRIRGLIGQLKCVILNVEEISEREPAAALPRLADVEHPNSVALLQHSSGTTGFKKGVALSFGQIRAQIEAYAAAISATPADKTVSWLPLYHDMGLVTSFLLPLTVGSLVISIDAFEWLSRPNMVFELIEDHSATLMWLPNFGLNHLVRTRDPNRTYNLSSLRAIIDCSEPCKPATFEAFRAAFAGCGLAPSTLQTCYAMAETVFGVAQSDLSQIPRIICVDSAILAENNVVITVPPSHPKSTRFLSCGRPIAGIQVQIADPTTSGPDLPRSSGNLAGSTAGEVLLAGEFVFSEYYRNPIATTDAFVDGWYKTGDIGFVDQGELFICGRKKEVLIVHGRNFYAHDIEEAVSTVAGVKPGRAVAFGLFDEATASEEVIVMAESALTSDASRQALRRRIKEAVFARLELTVKQVELCESGALIKTTSGKISRQDNMNRYIAGSARKVQNNGG